jgi:hypothetical protein
MSKHVAELKDVGKNQLCYFKFFGVSLNYEQFTNTETCKIK